MTQGMNEVPKIEIMEPVLIQVVCVGLTVKVMSRGILHPIFVMSILGEVRLCVTMRRRDLLDIPPHCT